jgi:peptidoglycan hydrolase CwlO-like protein
MKKYLTVSLTLLSITALVQAMDFGYLKPEDQKYYKNEAMAGLNQQERIDSTVKEINKLHAEIALLKKEMAALKAELQATKNAPKP